MTSVLYEKRDRIAYVTLNRPEAKNALGPEQEDLLREMWHDVEHDDDVDVAILTGTGDAFCAGADLKTFVLPRVEASTWQLREQVAAGFGGGITRGGHRMAKPVIAAINGWALAGGMELALACDIRIASERAVIGSVEARRGYHSADGGIVRLINACGLAVALELELTAEPVDARRAMQLRLVTRMVPHDSLMKEAEKVARAILRNDQQAVRQAKQIAFDLIGMPLDDQLRLEALYGYLCVANPATPGRIGEFFDKTDADRIGPGAGP